MGGYNGQDRKSEFADAANFLKSSDIPLYCCQFNVSESMFLCIRLLFRNNKTFWRFLMLSCRGFFFFFKWYAIGAVHKLRHAKGGGGGGGGGGRGPEQL